MSALVELFLAGLDVLKAEFAQARNALARVGAGVAFLLAGAAVLVIAVQRVLNALFLVLWETMSRPAAELLTGIAAVLVAGCLVWIGINTARR